MAGLSGADLDRLRELADLVERNAQTLDGVTRAARAEIAGSARFWEGPDAVNGEVTAVDVSIHESQLDGG